MNPYPQLKELSLPLIEHYHNDLLVHDLGAINADPDVPFMHWTNVCGTHLVQMFPGDSLVWPARGKSVPYLFGYATREKLLDGKLEEAKVHNQQGGALLTLHWDGRVLHQRTTGRAVEIVREYVTHVGTAWNYRAGTGKWWAA